MEPKKNLFIFLVTFFAFYLVNGCSKTDGPEGQVFEAEGYVIGYHPCVTHSTVTTSRGEGKGYLVATTGTDPDTLMVYGVPVGMFDIPGEWFFHSAAYLLPEEGRKTFKMRFSYQASAEGKSIGSQYACNAMWPLAWPIEGLDYTVREHIVVKAEKIE